MCFHLHFDPLKDDSNINQDSGKIMFRAFLADVARCEGKEKQKNISSHRSDRARQSLAKQCISRSWQLGEVHLHRITVVFPRALT